MMIINLLQDNQVNVWKYQRYGICEEYEAAALPPPFSLMVWLLDISVVAYQCSCSDSTDAEEDDNEKRIIKWKEHVLESLMKEASITYLKNEKQSAEGNLRNVMNDVAKPLQDQIALLDLQTKLLKEDQLTRTAARIVFRSPASSNRRESVPESNKSYMSRYLFKKKKSSQAPTSSVKSGPRDKNHFKDQPREDSEDYV